MPDSGAAIATIDIRSRTSLMEGYTMLVLSRRVGEEIVIDGRIRITISSIKGDRVRVGITAPPDVPVHRLEVYQRALEFADSVKADEPALV